MRFYNLKKKQHFEAKPEGFRRFKNGARAAYATQGGTKYYRIVKKK